MKKYELTSETKGERGVTLHRIRALVDIKRYGVKAGDLGGWIESEANLDHKSEAWVSGDALVFGDARVSDKARVFGEAQVFGDARVFGEARVSGDAWVSGKAQVFGDAWVSGKAQVFGDDDTTTFFRTKFLTGFAISVCCGCFRGTVAEFRVKVKQTHGDSKHGKAYQLAADLAEIQIELDEEGL